MVSEQAVCPRRESLPTASAPTDKTPSPVRIYPRPTMPNWVDALLLGAFHDAIFNTARRVSSQILYIAPPFIGAYFLVDWATHRYEHVWSSA